MNIKEVKRLDDGTPFIIELVSEESDGYEMSVKWDGCIDIRRREENGFGEYLHVCEVEQFINTLAEVIEIAKDNFGDNFDQYWSNKQYEQSKASLPKELIDGSEVLGFIEKIKDDDGTPKNYGALLDIMRFIREQPTTLDLGMVVKQLEDYGKWKGKLISNGKNYDHYIPVSVAKQIVQARGLGGVLGYMEDENE